LIAAIKRSAYVQDAHKNLREWERRTDPAGPNPPLN
jgi:hypothetical protein